MDVPEGARRLLLQAVAEGAVPGGVALLARRDGAAARPFAFGVRREDGPAVTPDTRYDLASLTKVVATLPSLLRLVAEGEVGLDDRLERFFSNAGWYQTPSLADATVRQLLAHSAGVRAWWPLFAEVSTRHTALAAVLQARVDGEVGRSRYSDVSYMLAGALVERVAGVRLDAFVREHVHAPLGMHATGFGPVVGVPVAATERCGWRNRLLEGEVHDENASVWEGVAGHAGTFSTAADLARYATAWLTRDARLGPEELLAEATSTQASGDDDVPRGLGWVLAHEGCFAGGRLPGYGHTGFTGTSIWIDPDAGLASVLLTNRVHPHRARGSGIVALRRAFHGAVHAPVAGALEGARA